MYVNYGDRNFFEYGILVDTEHSDTVFSILYCRPYDGEEDRYLFAECEVDIEDSWIDKAKVMAYIGMDGKNWDPVEYAIGCIEYYGAENFGGNNYAYDFTNMDKSGICEILRHRLIASDNLDIVW